MNITAFSNVYVHDVSANSIPTFCVLHLLKVKRKQEICLFAKKHSYLVKDKENIFTIL